MCPSDRQHRDAPGCCVRWETILVLGASATPTGTILVLGATATPTGTAPALRLHPMALPGTAQLPLSTPRRLPDTLVPSVNQSEFKRL